MGPKLGFEVAQRLHREGVSDNGSEQGAHPFQL
jgi:hypothetical protein